MLSTAVTPGAGALRFAHVAGRTAVVQALAASPLRLLTPRRHGEAAWAYTSSFGGGLVDGDEVSLDVDVGRDAAALVTTQASTKIYRSPRGCSQALDVRVAEGAALALLPDPIVCFAQARYAQAIHIRLAADASLVLVDALTAGRSAHGERWAFDRYESRIRIARDGGDLLRDNVLLDPAHGALSERMGRFDALATLVVLGPRFAAAAAALCQSAAREPLAREPALLEVASPLGDGALVRVAAISVEAAVLRVRSRLAFTAATFGGDPWSHKL